MGWPNLLANQTFLSACQSFTLFTDIKFESMTYGLGVMTSFALLVAIRPPMGQSGSYSLNLPSIFVLPYVTKFQVSGLGCMMRFTAEQ